MPNPIKAILIGAGQRGADSYGPYALEHPDQIQFVAVAEPNPERRERFAAQHRIPPENQFTSWEPLLEKPRMGEAALVCTQDWQHVGPTTAALEAGYHVLLEKPMAVTKADCLQLVNTSMKTGQQLHICHLLRYTKHFETMKSILQSGALGQITNIDHRENVSYYHMAHSYVRGNWRTTAESSPMILAKCCHDLDILIWLLDQPCAKLHSFGSLSHFRPDNAPEGAPTHCLNGCPVAESCPYFAPFIYIDLLPIWRAVETNGVGLPKLAATWQQRAPGLVKQLSKVFPILREVSEYRGWPRSVVALDPTPEKLLTALETGPYGRCVYHCDNNVVDHQIIAMEFENGITTTLTMHGHSHLEGRTTRIQGSRGELQAFFGTGGSWIDTFEHRSGLHKHYNTRMPIVTGHGGGDEALMAAFVRSLQDPSAQGLTTVHQALESHLMAFAAETSRLENRVIHMADYREEA